MDRTDEMATDGAVVIAVGVGQRKAQSISVHVRVRCEMSVLGQPSSSSHSDGCQLFSLLVGDAGRQWSA